MRIRPLEPVKTSVEPRYFDRMRAIEVALRAGPPDVVIVQDVGAPGYSALRLQDLGLAFENTLFVVYCHGTRQWITNTSRKVRVLPGALAVSRLEQATVELADVVVSPSAYMVEWMRQQGWRLPTAAVIPLLTRSAATGESPPQPVVQSNGAVHRLAFFGRLEERKGVRPFVAGLNALAPELLEGIEVEFLGRATTEVTPERVEALLSETARNALGGVSFETELDQHEALARLSRPGTVAFMPSLEDNSPATIYECLERGIPFMASALGGASELVAPEERTRVLFEPTVGGIATALQYALAGGDALRPVRPSFDDTLAAQRWADVVAMRPRAVEQLRQRPAVDAIVVHRASREALARCVAALGAQTYEELREPLAVDTDGRSVEAAREVGLQAAEAPWVIFLDEEDVPERDFVETLVRAQAASGADVVSCGLYLGGNGADRAEHFFGGNPGGVGLLPTTTGQPLCCAVPSSTTSRMPGRPAEILIGRCSRGSVPGELEWCRSRCHS